MSKSTWTGAVNSDWADAGNWSPAGIPGAGSDVTIATGDAVASASIGTVNSITDSSDLSFESAGTNTVTTVLDDAGHLWVDHDAGEGGTILNIGGMLTNSNHLVIGNAALSASDEVTAASVDNTGSIVLKGSGTDQALLDVTAGSAGFGATGVLSGDVRLVGDSAIEFATGEITSLAAHAILRLNGSDAFVEDSSALASNSALTGLASIGAGAILGLHNNAAVSTSGSLVNDGNIRLDFVARDGGSSLTLGGTLTNSGVLKIGNVDLSASDEVATTALTNKGSIYLDGSSTNQALLDVTASVAGFGTAGTLTGFVGVQNDAAIEFASGSIDTIATGGELLLYGKNALVEDSKARGSNSALTGLSNVAGALEMDNGAALSTTGALDDSGFITVEEAGSSLSIGGELTVTGAGLFELSNVDISSSVSATAESLNNSGTVNLFGNGNLDTLATLNVSGATTNNGSITIDSDIEELAGAVRGAGSFSLSNSNLQFDSSVSAGQTITETGKNALVLEQAQNFAATISGFGTGDTIDAVNFHAPPATTYNFVENIAGTGGTLTLHDGSLTANILMTGDYSNSSFTLAPDHGTGTLVKFV